MSDLASRVAAHETALLSMAMLCTLCPGRATHNLSWRDGIWIADGLNYCDACGMVKVNTQWRQTQRVELTLDLIERRMVHLRKEHPLPYRSTVKEIA